MTTHAQTGAAPVAEGESASSRAETVLADGTVVRVEVKRPDGGVPIAERALKAAGSAVVEAMGAPPAREREPSGTRIVGRSEAMRELFRLLDRIRGSSATVLITGDNGTGKELVAHAIHEQSTRGAQRFVATNCSAFNDNLLESELFGHRRGSFTGAVADKPGLFEVADKGTFFLDEVGDMSPALQVKLLRVLQEGTFLPVGGTEPRKVDVRIIGATNRDLSRMVATGAFREDLYYRLHVVALRVPPLRERKDDIPRLVNHFLARLTKRDGRRKVLTQTALDRLMEHDWPGNVRELENEIERLWVLSGPDGVIGDEDIGPQTGRNPHRTPPPSVPPIAGGDEIHITGSTLPEAVEALERKMIGEALRRVKGNKTRAAQALGISRRNLIRKVQAYGLDDRSRDKAAP